MFRRLTLFFAIAALACVNDPGPTGPGSPPPPPPPPPPPTDVRLADMEIPSLPSPYYQFEYDPAGRVTFVSFASDLRTYDVQYEGTRIIQMVSTRFSRELLTYFYDMAGKVSTVTYTNALGVVYVRIHLSYAGERLVRLERERRIDDFFELDKRLSFTYDTEGNLLELTDERLPFPGQTEARFVDRFERYDEGINVDGFDLVHSEFFDHVVLLPGVKLQVNNPAGVTRSGDGINYHVDYTYTYDSDNRPITKHGEGTMLGGTTPGEHFVTNAGFSYK